MRLKRLKLSNFCQHRDLEVEFPPGITGILGGNGQGKSNLVKAIRFALIGESGNVGVKTEDLNWHAARAGEPGYVELDFEAGGEDGTLKRFVSSTRTSLKHSSMSTTSSSKATAAILGISGVTRGTFEDIIFVDQGKIETILFEKPAERAKKFQRLFGTESAEKLRQLLHQELAMLTTDPVDDRIKELEQQLATDIDPQLRALGIQQREMSAIIKGNDEAHLTQLVKDFELSETAKSQLADLLKQKKRCEDGVDPEYLKTFAAEVNKMHSEMAAKRVMINAVRAQLANMQQAHALESTRSRLQDEIAEYNEKLKSKPPKPPAVTPSQLEDSQKQIDMARAEVSRHTHFIQTFEQGRPLCPTCNQPVPNALSRVEKSREIVESRMTLIGQVEQMLTAARNELSDYRSSLSVYEKEIASARELITKRKVELGQLPAAPELRGDEAALKQQIEAFESMEVAMEAKALKFRTLKEQGARSSGELESINRQIEHTQKSINETITSEQYAKAKDALEQVEQIKLAIAELAGQLKQLQAARVRVLAELEGLRLQAGSLAAKRKYKILCERTRELLHRDVLPRRVTQRYLQMLNEAIREYIELLDVPFGCYIDDALNVTCTIPGVGDKPAERLSGGQRVMLGIAFRFAICRLFSAGLGFVVLDEPTSMVDETHVGIVADLLTRIKSHVLSTGLQLIVITHHGRLASAFDHTIGL